MAVGVKCVALLAPWDNGGIHGIGEGLLCAAGHVPAELKGLFCSICLKAAGLYDSCRGLATQVVLTLPTQIDFSTIPGIVCTGKFLQGGEGLDWSGIRSVQSPAAPYGDRWLWLCLWRCSAWNSCFSLLGSNGKSEVCGAPGALKLGLSATSEM